MLQELKRLPIELTTPENTITYHNALRLSHQILHKHCFQFLLGPFYLPRENEDNAYAKYGIVFKVNLLEHLNVYSILRHLIYKNFRNL